MNVGVLLAGGASSRMGSPKALARARGESFAARGVRALWAACDTVVVVLGADARRLRPAIEDEFVALVERGALHRDVQAARRHGAPGLEVRFAVNAGWRHGMLTSVRVGLSAALALKPAAVLVLPVDHPHVKPATVASLAAVMAEALGAFGGGPSPQARGGFPYALVPRFGGRRGHPVALSPALAAAVRADRRASSLADAIRSRARLVGYLDVRDPGVLRNRNTPRD
jgi:nicotine blue oxidoreductase